MMLTAVVLFISIASALLYLRRRKWIDALLVLLAAAALALLGAGLTMPGAGNGANAADGDVRHASFVTAAGDGMSRARWNDLPARPLRWTAPATPALWLDFPRVIAVGSPFRLTVQRERAAPGTLKLLAENGRVLAEAKGSGANLAVEWLPPAAEALVMRARLLDSAGKVTAEGPVPFVVRDTVPLRVTGHFSAPSFDAQALNDLLTRAGAVLDWHVTLGRGVTRAETPKLPMPQPDLTVVDAAWLEKATAGERARLLDEVSPERPLLVLGATAATPAFWQRELGLSLGASVAEREAEAQALKVSAAPLVPRATGAWRTSANHVAYRDWKGGRIAWLGVADWHRNAITEPRALAQWWQGVLDAAGVRRTENVSWLAPEEMPLPNQRLEICATGVTGTVTFPQLKQALDWQHRAERTDAACVAVWPRSAGWLRAETANGKEIGQYYVYSTQDWPQWQAAQHRAATREYARRTPQAPEQVRQPLPGWPFALLFLAAALALWWRERR